MSFVIAEVTSICLPVILLPASKLIPNARGLFVQQMTHFLGFGIEKCSLLGLRPTINGTRSTILILLRSEFRLFSGYWLTSGLHCAKEFEHISAKSEVALISGEANWWLASTVS